MNNRNLEIQKNNVKKELGDFQSTAENIIDELVSEIENIESELDDARKTIEELNEEISNLNTQLEDAQQEK